MQACRHCCRSIDRETKRAIIRDWLNNAPAISGPENNQKGKP